MRTIATPFDPSIGQTGDKKDGSIEFLAQMLLDDFAPVDTTTGNSLGKAADHLKLIASSYPSSTQSTDLKGYENFLSWIKNETVYGNHVIIGIIEESTTPNKPYGHIVNVVRVESDFPESDLSYHGNDTLWIDDHG